MNAQQAENLRILIRHMETKCERTLYMEVFAHACGTPACALGEATVCAGLQGQLPPRASQVTISRDARDVFGVNFVMDMNGHSGDALRLFGHSQENAWKRAKVTPQEWAVEARKVLSEHGYSMEDEAYAAFKAKLLVPLQPEHAPWTALHRKITPETQDAIAAIKNAA